jgi:hypothetical protein
MGKGGNEPQKKLKDQGDMKMKNSISKYMMIAAAAVALFAAMESKAAPGGGGTTAPTPVEEQNVPARTAVDVVYFCVANQNSCKTNFVIPTGMRLVIENINGFVYNASVVPLYFFLYSQLDGVNLAGEFFSATAYRPWGPEYITEFTRNVKIYTDALFNISFGVASTGSSSIHLHGYLVKK